ncbi:hypothetical protein T03_14338 [Trichinella britovi]|uniref:Uncharacterized protein n=2 Tax=Trichinella TaxID=6333 RepID=A0A0V1CLL8_TRIBR|nr:hypothetical protein T05_5086 [Trichinella murrelli]KRX55455.1 hypothetical protein T09_1125 [Trichinella sp. T9]KRX80234.1 hypothetical protein T06_14514 [Trichinella sp. T6]KRY50201.1 hypothetical protein T03_14338 [Trichinella britovi]KRZ90194.1 hypothetical protein T08_13432 [Trichinella sp. T8]
MPIEMLDQSEKERKKRGLIPSKMKFIFRCLCLNESLNFKFAWSSLTRTILPNFAGCSRLLD